MEWGKKERQKRKEKKITVYSNPEANQQHDFSSLHTVILLSHLLYWHSANERDLMMERRERERVCV